MTITIKQADHSSGSQRLYNVCLVGPMDKAPVYGTGDSGFESPAGLTMLSRPAPEPSRDKRSVVPGHNPGIGDSTFEKSDDYHLAQDSCPVLCYMYSKPKSAMSRLIKIYLLRNEPHPCVLHPSAASLPSVRVPYVRHALSLSNKSYMYMYMYMYIYKLDGVPRRANYIVCATCSLHDVERRPVQTAYKYIIAPIRSACMYQGEGTGRSGGHHVRRRWGSRSGGSDSEVGKTDEKL